MKLINTLLLLLFTSFVLCSSCDRCLASEIEITLDVSLEFKSFAYSFDDSIEYLCKQTYDDEQEVIRVCIHVFY